MSLRAGERADRGDVADHLAEAGRRRIERDQRAEPVEVVVGLLFLRALALGRRRTGRSCRARCALISLEHLAAIGDLAVCGRARHVAERVDRARGELSELVDRRLAIGARRDRVEHRGRLAVIDGPACAAGEARRWVLPSLPSLGSSAIATEAIVASNSNTRTARTDEDLANRRSTAQVGIERRRSAPVIPSMDPIGRDRARRDRRTRGTAGRSRGCWPRRPDPVKFR